MPLERRQLEDKRTRYLTLSFVDSDPKPGIERTPTGPFVSLLKAEGRRLRARFDAVPRFALIICCAFAGLRLVVHAVSPDLRRERASLPQRQVGCAAQQLPSEWSEMGQPQTFRPTLTHDRFTLDSRH